MATTNPLPARKIAALRRELAQAERNLREEAEREAQRLVEAERIAWLEAQESFLQIGRIHRNVNVRPAAILKGAQQRFSGERQMAEMALRDVERWELLDSAAYTVISFACRRDRLRYLRGSAERESTITETLQRGGVYDERGHFMEILR